jgi:prepilin signal peptidase PulO-like enzyme (type II secretory pathway)
MAAVLSIFGVIFAAFCVWLAVRIINRREHWAKRSLATAIGLPVLYVASFGPACAFVDRRMLPRSTLNTVFSPCVFLVTDEPKPLGNALSAWAAMCGDEHALATAVLEPLAKLIINH